MLASKRFMRSNLINGKFRMFRRETYLDEKALRFVGKSCSCCHRTLHYNETVAIATNLTIFCRNCYGEMSEKEALRQITEQEYNELRDEKIDGIPLDDIGAALQARKFRCAL